jgi:chromosome segregation protein
LLKLKRVEIQGFKSFYDRTEMKFNGSGIAAVVGPNGCGKSNLSDAISWVLGEQSAKSLRGARMEDVIFAGTRDRKALSMASVTMTLVPDERTLINAVAKPVPEIAETPTHEDEEGEAPSATAEVEPTHADAATHRTYVDKTAEKTGEITITRRLYRSGESEYLINGKTARLRDIQDLFMGTGLGPESYAIIEQGRIGQILSNRPQDRRALIEEAAGITKFKTRKRLAEAKLESAKQNLARVFDILEEVTRQVNSLKRQAAKTKRYSELKAEGTGYLKQVLAAKFSALERETAKVTIELNLATAELQSAQDVIAAREGEQTALAETSHVVEAELTQARQQLADLQLEAERARGRLEYQSKQIQQIEQRVGAGEQEAKLLAQQEQERTAEWEQHSAELDGLGARVADVREQLESKAAERGEAQARLTEQERGLEAARQQVLRLMGQASGFRNRITQVEAQLAAADREATRASTEESQSSNDQARIEDAKKQLSGRLSARQMELISVTEQRQVIEQELQQTRTQLGETRQQLERVRSEHSRVKARRDSLDELIQHRSYTTDTVKRLFTAVEKGNAPELQLVGVLADFMEVDPQWEKATEEFLHDELEYVVVRDWANAERGIEFMRGDINGHATFLVEATQETAGTAEELPQPGSEAGPLTKLTDKLRFTNGLAKLPLHSLPRISHCYLTEDRQAAQELAGRYSHCWFLSNDGVSYHGQALSGGKKTGAGPLALKRELREVTQLEQTKQAEFTAAQARLASLERTLAELTEELESIRSKQQKEEKDVLALDHESRKLAEELQRVQARLSNARLELERLGRDRTGLQNAVQQDREALEQAETERSAQERALDAARGELVSFQEDVARTSEEHAMLRANMASLEERQRSLTANCSRLEAQVREFGNRRDNLLREGERLMAERTHLMANNEEIAGHQAQLHEARTAAEDRARGLEEQERELRSQLSALGEQLRELRTQANAAQEQKSTLQVSLARSESDLKYLEETCAKELETTLAELAKEVEITADDAALVDFEAKYNDVRRKIEALGPVNSQALEEYEEAQQRQDFLNTQRQDLLDSIRDTEKAIHEIDGESRKRFGEAFHLINANFREMFATLFGGGVGEMRLTDEDNLSESGIDIVASPPGKKLQSVLLLSGGEKSLTAMALLMGIFQYLPSPFCVLDEVDAPLDEPNTERLTRLLREMANETQFIVITHSKRTMEAAQSLYGVTMQEPGVSKLVSVKFGNRQGTLNPKARVPAKAEPVLEHAMA